MQTEAVEYFAERGLEIPKLISKAPHGVSRHRIEAAADHVYNMISTGEQRIKNINLARAVWEVAKTIDASEYQKVNIAANDTKVLSKKIDEQQKKISELKKGYFMTVFILFYWAFVWSLVGWQI